jgi:hypothetical protein
LIDNELSKLNQLYMDADNADKALFSEQRSNCLLYVGQHYSKQDSALNHYIRGQKSLAPEKKLRLTKNHIGAICDRLINSTVTSHSPSVLIQPKHKMEIQDKKAADIASGVWSRVSTFNRFSDSIPDYAFDFIVGGEMASFISFDPSKGEYLGEADVISEAGELLGKKPKFSGEVVIEKLETFNLLREPGARSWETAAWIMTRKMVPIEKLKAQFGEDEDKVSKLSSAQDETFIVFDSQKGQYTQSEKDKALVKQIFYRPCEEYPEGYYKLFTSDLLLAEGTLNGIFPIVFKPYTKVTTSPRGYAIIKRLRPCQAEINRIASTIAMAQLYGFRDRLMIQNGSKLSNGGTMGNAVVMRYSGAMPQVHQGQSGEKYLPMLSQQIEEMYRLANLALEEEEKTPTTDSMSLLYRSLKDKKRFSQKSDQFESFVKEVVEVSLKTAQKFYTEEHIVHAVDKKDLINIAEFQNITNFDYSIEIKSISQDIDSTLGQAVAIQHAIQYGQNLPPEQLAILVANMPYLKDSHMTQELTADLRAVEDVFAAIERGEDIGVLESDNHDYFIKRISNRMKESSFRYLHPFIQNLYRERLQQHEAIKAEQAEKIMRAQQGMIPAGGALIPVSLYLDPDNASKRVRLPHDAVTWLYKKLSEQGSLQSEMQELGNEQAIADIAGMLPQMPEQTPDLFSQDDTMLNSLQPGAGEFNGQY